MFCRITFGSAAALLALGAAAQQPAQPQPEKKTLGIGDEAPAIDIEHWIKGDKVAEFEDDKVYVVEFWATWCGPCLSSMPHISKLQEQYEDYNVRFIGISDEGLETVQTFLNQEGWKEKTEYTLAADPDRSVFGDYMDAAGQGGIPTAFVVGKDQKIEWIGHPMAIDKVIEKVVHDKWDREAYKAELALATELQVALQARDMDRAVEVIDQLIASSSEPAQYKLQKAYIFITAMNKPEEGYKLLAEGLESVWDDAQTLNQIAWAISSSPEQFPNSDLDLMQKAAERAVELTKREDASILDTLAHVHYRKGDLKKAVAVQREAIEKAEPEMVEDLKATLAAYEKELKGGGD